MSIFKKKKIKKYLRVRKFNDKEFSYIAKEVTGFSRFYIEKARYHIMKEIDRYVFYVEEVEVIGDMKFNEI